jgi:hypothetical protein
MQMHYSMKYVQLGKVNCHKAIFTIDVLVNTEGGLLHPTIITAFALRTGIMYVTAIVTEKKGLQVEKSYKSDMRCRSLHWLDALVKAKGLELLYGRVAASGSDSVQWFVHP